jgi:hypothetical protein
MGCWQPTPLQLPPNSDRNQWALPSLQHTTTPDRTTSASRPSGTLSHMYALPACLLFCPWPHRIAPRVILIPSRKWSSQLPLPTSASQSAGLDAPRRARAWATLCPPSPASSCAPPTRLPYQWLNSNYHDTQLGMTGRCQDRAKAHSRR